jgi:hypothetical protein
MKLKLDWGVDYEIKLKPISIMALQVIGTRPGVWFQIHFRTGIGLGGYLQNHIGTTLSYGIACNWN